MTPTIARIIFSVSCATAIILKMVSSTLLGSTAWVATATLRSRCSPVSSDRRLGRTSTAVSGLITIPWASSFIPQKLDSEMKMARSSAL